PDAVLSGPPGASRAQGGLRIALQATLGGGLPGVKRFFERYPHTCLEQQASRAIGLRDAQRWSELMQQLPTHLDGDGLAAYFPLQEGAGPQGSVALTAYLLSISHEAGWRLPDETRERLLTGLSDVVQGRIRRSTWAPSGVAQAVVNDVQRVNALDALSRHGRADARMLDTVSPTLGDWPTAAVIQWWQVLQRLPAALSREARMKDAEQTLRSRLTYSGTTLRFSTEAQDFWWWTMDSADANAARLILAVRQLPAWKDELPRLVVGALGRQRNGAWLTTPANAWGTLALERFGQQAERTPISGRSVVKLAAAEATLDWASAPTGQVLALPWPVQAVKGGAPASQPLQLRQDGTGAPWATVQALSAVPLKAPVQAGYAVRRTVSVVDAPNSARPSERGAAYARGTVLRVTLEIDAQADMNWVAVQDPIPGGATLLGSGLGRDSHQATRGEQAAGAWPSHVERGQDAWRAYYAFLPKGRHRVDYTVRLNNPGRFNVPPTRVEAMYAPDSFGEAPQPRVEVAP
ncbi:MAG: alpha-2-macroglobulin, partial [Aquabacterium commune]